MSVIDLALLGPLAPLVGEWEGDQGVDVSFHNDVGQVIETPYRERTTFSPFGPVDNGPQALYGLDYRMAAWRGEEIDPFHTEVGYWLWDARDQQVMRCFVVPRGNALIAGGLCRAEDRSFTMQAEVGSESYGVLSNVHLAAQARTTLFQVRIDVHDDGSWSYDETTSVELARVPGEVFAHTDRNTLHRVG